MSQINKISTKSEQVTETQLWRKTKPKFFVHPKQFIKNVEYSVIQKSKGPWPTQNSLSKKIN